MVDDAFKSHESDYDKTYDLFEEFCKYTNEKEKLFKEIKKALKENYTVLDIGAGTGELTHRLAGFCEKAVALDKSKSVLEYSKRKAEKRDLSNIDFIQKEWVNVKVAELDTFDSVICSHTLYFMEDQARAIRKMFEATEGNVIFVVHSGRGEFTKFLERFWPLVNNEPYEHGNSYEDVCELLEELGFQFRVNLVEARISISDIRKALELCGFFFENPEFNYRDNDALREFFQSKFDGNSVTFQTENAVVVAEK